MTDPEIDAMSAVAGALAGLESDAQARVIWWASERFGLRIPNHSDGHQAAKEGSGPDDVEGGPEVGSRYEHFAELFDAAQPKDKEERLLIAAYWRQHIQGQASFGSQELNKDLKDLGHHVDHISTALAASVGKKPALILQLRKSGNSQQARKTYKLSGEGVKAVESLLRNNR